MSLEMILVLAACVAFVTFPFWMQFYERIRKSRQQPPSEQEDAPPDKRAQDNERHD
jgi:hypothetical protein